ncbi:MAG: pantoate--beta-alanine ligase, partial [Pseudomonadota bacterium]|nr:pantoate--beta-alanine ligase [Pseudomonadota bacterium]
VNMECILDVSSLRKRSGQWRRDGQSSALVPTMGNLHSGHLSLLERAKELADRTIVSIFVNPIQFGVGEDYQIYPSTMKEDLVKLGQAGADVVFMPDLKELYPGGTEDDTRITVPQISDILCGEFRKGHFSGVATVVSKLLINSLPDFALFGEKDFQQILVIKRMVVDLLLPVEIVAMPTCREGDGLAMSSRNRYLDEKQRKISPVIYRTLAGAARQLERRDMTVKDIESEGVESLSECGMKVEYFSIRRQVDLKPADSNDRNLVILAAVWLGEARLIDNLKVDLIS